MHVLTLGLKKKTLKKSEVIYPSLTLCVFLKYLGTFGKSSFMFCGKRNEMNKRTRRASHILSK